MASTEQFHYHRAGKLHFFCPLCHFHQSTNTISRFGWRHLGQLLLLTVFSSYLLWPLFGWKGASLFFVYWAAFDMAYRLRKRQALICRSCGFDPFLYRQDVQKARLALRKHWEERIQKENLFAGKKLRNYQTQPANASPPPAESPLASASAGENLSLPGSP